jgi:hypothetical protein
MFDLPAISPGTELCLLTAKGVPGSRCKAMIYSLDSQNMVVQEYSGTYTATSACFSQWQATLSVEKGWQPAGFSRGRSYFAVRYLRKRSLQP